MKIRMIARRLRAASAMALVATVVTLAAWPANAVYAQRRTTTRTQPPAAATLQPKAPASLYGKAYQKGYGEGYRQGESDWRQSYPRDYIGSDAYQQREQLFEQGYAKNEEYRQGFELGFELGYMDGYYGRPRDLTEPANAAVLAKAAAMANVERNRTSQPDRTQPPVNEPPPSEPPVEESRPRVTDSRGISVPAGTELQLRLNDRISTKDNQVGDRFTAEVLSPSPYAGATVEGHISSLKKSGKVTGRTEIAFEFDEITFPDGRRGPITADLDRIIESEKVKKVDEEGRVESGSRTRDTQVRGGVGATAGAIIGGIIGGGKGAVLGAILGGAAGVSTVYVEGTKDLVLEPGTEMIVRTARSRAR